MKAGDAVLGGVVKATGGSEIEWDAALIRVDDNIARKMAAKNLQAVVKSFWTTLRSVATPHYDCPADQSRQTYHAGRTSELTGDIYFVARPGFVDIAHGTGTDRVNRARVTMKMRETVPGDSGGPVFTANGELVGFISVGLRPGETRIILAAPVLERFGATLATIGNEAQWRPAALVLKSDDEDDSSGGEPARADAFAGKKVRTTST